MDADELTLWQTHENGPCDASLAALVDYYQDWVAYLAGRKYAPSNACVDMLDLVSAGNVGLLQSIDRFDRSKGGNFEGFAYRRVTGEMQTLYRGLDTLKPWVRMKGTAPPVFEAFDETSTVVRSASPQERASRAALLAWLATQMRPELYAIVVQKYFLGRSDREIGKVFGMSWIRVQADCAEAMDVLRETLGDRRLELVG